MAKTLLNGVNEVLKRVGIIQGDTAELTTLTDSSRQRPIDLSIQAWNEAVDELYSLSNLPKPNEMVEGTLTLATSDRDYALATGLTQLYFPLHDTTNGHYIYEYDKGYLHLVNSQPFPANENGLPNYAVIRPSDGQLYLDRIPTATENGNQYTYYYDTDLVVSAAADTFPFKDVVFRAMVPAVTEIVNRELRKQYDGEIIEGSLGRASRYLIQKQQKESYLPTRSYINPTDPFEE